SSGTFTVNGTDLNNVIVFNLKKQGYDLWLLILGGVLALIIFVLIIFYRRRKKGIKDVPISETEDLY
ncbi:MAG: LPXTG cell wall anchor domain-containing protein, partial [Thermoplasmata archaeon]